MSDTIIKGTNIPIMAVRNMRVKPSTFAKLSTLVIIPNHSEDCSSSISIHFSKGAAMIKIAMMRGTQNNVFLNSHISFLKLVMTCELFIGESPGSSLQQKYQPMWENSPYLTLPELLGQHCQITC